MPETSSSLLDTIETSARSAVPDSYQAFLRRSRDSEWLATYNLYATVADLNPGQTLSRFENCRKSAWFVRNELTGAVKVASSHCNLRWCPLCAETRQVLITQATKDWLETCHHPKLLTLTLRHTSSPLESQIDFLYHSFQKLRKRALIKNHCDGGIWFFQVKRSKRDHNWHPHIHATIDGDFIAHRKIQKLWARITRGSDQVNIKACTNIENSSKHIARYASRPADLTDHPELDRLELYNALQHRRLVGSWGSAREISFTPKKPADADLWHKIANWSTVRHLLGFSDEADLIWKCFLTNEPLPATVSMNPLENSLLGSTEISPRAPDPQGWLDFFLR